MQTESGSEMRTLFLGHARGPPFSVAGPGSECNMDRDAERTVRELGKLSLGCSVHPPEIC